MELRVAELAQAAGIGVDTVRFYQARGLIPAPHRRGRFAIYGPEHLERVRRIRALLEAGFSLAQIRRLLAGESDGDESTSLLESLAAKSVGQGTLSLRELAGETGVPEAIVAAVVRAGLLAPIEIAGEQRFPRSDLDMVRAGLAVLGEGLPLERLLELATRHSAGVADLAERAIDLFDDHVRKRKGEDEAAVRDAFERLLPRATEIVALHFQRTVLARALARLREKGDRDALEKTLAVARSARLEVQWR